MSLIQVLEVPWDEPDPTYPCWRCGEYQLPENFDEDGCCDAFTRRGRCAGLAAAVEAEEG